MCFHIILNYKLNNKVKKKTFFVKYSSINDIANYARCSKYHFILFIRVCVTYSRYLSDSFCQFSNSEY